VRSFGKNKWGKACPQSRLERKKANHIEELNRLKLANSYDGPELKECSADLNRLKSPSRSSFAQQNGRSSSRWNDSSKRPNEQPQPQSHHQYPESSARQLNRYAGFGTASSNPGANGAPKRKVQDWASSSRDSSAGSQANQVASHENPSPFNLKKW